MSVCTLYPTAATQAVAESSLFIAAQLRTGPACLSQDLGVEAAIVGDECKYRGTSQSILNPHNYVDALFQ